MASSEGPMVVPRPHVWQPLERIPSLGCRSTFQSSDLDFSLSLDLWCVSQRPNAAKRIRRSHIVNNCCCYVTYTTVKTLKVTGVSQTCRVSLENIWNVASLPRGNAANHAVTVWADQVYTLYMHSLTFHVTMPTCLYLGSCFLFALFYKCQDVKTGDPYRDYKCSPLQIVFYFAQIRLNHCCSVLFCLGAACLFLLPLVFAHISECLHVFFWSITFLNLSLKIPL